METFCQNPLCQNKAVKEVLVSVRGAADQKRSLCAACDEAYTWGIQHGWFSTEQQKAKHKEERDTNMLNRVYGAIEEVLDTLDVGGEQSRQFAEEINILKGVLGYPEPPEDELDEIQRRRVIASKLRALAVEAGGLGVSLPTLPVAKWLDGTVQDATVDVNFQDHDLAKLLRFIADVGIAS